MLKVCFTAAVLAVAALLLAGPGSTAEPKKAEPKATKTLENLQAAYNGESNAHNKYVLFAAKADKEGYKGVASLFRAAAEAEKVHSERFAEAIKALGAQPKQEIVDPEPGTTMDNLNTALKGEERERDTVYPAAEAQARTDKDSKAEWAFKWARLAESEHAALYTAALGDTGKWQEARTLFVCPKCGKTVEQITFKNCPVCNTPAAKFMAIK